MQDYTVYTLCAYFPNIPWSKAPYKRNDICQSFLIQIPVKQIIEFVVWQFFSEKFENSFVLLRYSVGRLAIVIILETHSEMDQVKNSNGNMKIIFQIKTLSISKSSIYRRTACSKILKLFWDIDKNIIKSSDLATL